MNRQDIAYQVSLTLGDHAADFDIDAIVDDLVVDGPIDNIDDIETDSYWSIVESHDVTPRVVRSDVEKADIDASRKDAFIDAIEVGRVLRETYTESDDGERTTSMTVRAYTDPDTHTSRFAVTYGTEMTCNWHDTPSETRAHALYEQWVRDEPYDSGEDERWTYSDVPGAPSIES